MSLLLRLLSLRVLLGSAHMQVLRACKELKGGNQRELLSEVRRRGRSATAGPLCIALIFEPLFCDLRL